MPLSIQQGNRPWTLLYSVNSERNGSRFINLMGGLTTAPQLEWNFHSNCKGVECCRLGFAQQSLFRLHCCKAALSSSQTNFIYFDKTTIHFQCKSKQNSSTMMKEIRKKLPQELSHRLVTMHWTGSWNWKVCNLYGTTRPSWSSLHSFVPLYNSDKW